MPEIDVTWDTGNVAALPVLPTSADVTLITSDCRLVGWSLRDTSTPVPAQAEGAVISPGAGVAIVNLAGLKAGVYDITWSVALQGAAAAADADNFKLIANNVTVENSVNAGAAGSYPQTGARVTIVAGNSVSINAIAAGTVGVTYLAQIEITPTPVAASVVEIQDSGNILGEISLPPGGSETHTMQHPGIPCQGQIKVHVISGAVTGVVYARLSR